MYWGSIELIPFCGFAPAAAFDAFVVAIAC
jgi:hypothetical protein